MGASSIFVSSAASRNSIVGLDHSLCIQFPTGGLLSCLPYFAVSVLLRISLYVYHFPCVQTHAGDKFPEGTAESKGKCICHFDTNSQLPCIMFCNILHSHLQQVSPCFLKQGSDIIWLSITEAQSTLWVEAALESEWDHSEGFCNYSEKSYSWVMGNQGDVNEWYVDIERICRICWWFGCGEWREGEKKNGHTEWGPGEQWGFCVQSGTC